MKPGTVMVMRIYQAVIWTSDDEPEQRVTVSAESWEDARAFLEQEFGVGTVLFMYNEQDASKPR